MDQSALVHPKEKLYFSISLGFSLVAYLGLVISIVGILYILMGAVMGLLVHGLFVGSLRGNGVKVGPNQFPDVHAITQKLSREMGMQEAPDVYVLQAGGMLNAFATRFLGRSFVVLYSDVVELARQQGEAALAFVICHELAHHHRKHTSRRLLLLPSLWVPFLGSAYSRACEYTCDAYGAHFCGRGAVDGLLVLAAGKELYRDVNVDAYARQAYADEGFFVWLSEVLTTHPHLPKRVAAVIPRIRSVQVGAIAPTSGAYATAQAQPTPS